MKLITSFIALLVTAFAYAQEYTLTGKVLDKENKPIEFATVILKKGNVIIKKSLTDDLGMYKLSGIRTGDYILISSCISFSKTEIPIQVTKDISLDIQLLPLSGQLQEVTIVSKKPVIETKPDRTIFNVENSTSTVGANALEALAKTPGVQVNNKGISLPGKGNVTVMIDDRPIQLSSDDLQNLLKSMSADDISKIEVIHSPGAQYDAQGTNGLINITTKRSTKLGYSGTVRLGYTQTTYPEGSTGGNLNYNKNKWKLHGNVNLTDGSNVETIQLTSFYPTQILEQNQRIRAYNQSLSGQVSADYNLSKATTLGLSYDGSTSKPNTKENITSPTSNLSNPATSYSTLTDANNDTKNGSHTIGLDLKHQIDTIGRKLAIHGDWFSSANNTDRTLINNDYTTNDLLLPNSFSQFRSGNKENINSYTLKTDIQLPFKIVSLAVGGKLFFTDIQNDVSRFQLSSGTYQPDYTQTNQFHYTENTQALYTSANKHVKKWNFDAGLRGEFTQIQVRTTATDQISTTPYMALFPTASISFAKNDTHTFSISYGRRIERPNYYQLNPFRTYLNPNAYTEGNPFLQPSFSNNIKLTHSYKGFPIISLSYDHLTGGVGEVTTINNGIQSSSFQNFVDRTFYELNTMSAFHPFTWLENTNMISLWYAKASSSSPQTQLSGKGFGAYFSTNNSISLDQAKTISGDINFWCILPSQDGLYQINTTYSLDLGLKMAVNKKIQIAINATDVLKSRKFNGSMFINQINQQFSFRPDSDFKLSITYKFGNNKIKDEGQQNEENNRAKKKSGMGL
ncbi:MAG: TonB-dependent receptor [Pedobacter sp.]|nr:MAG: TonB-dependent receptor [Pedobacter sp.]